MSPHIFVSDMNNNILSSTFWLLALDDLSYVKIILLHNNLDMWRYDALKCIDGRACVLWQENGERINFKSLNILCVCRRK